MVNIVNLAGRQADRQKIYFAAETPNHAVATGRLPPTNWRKKTSWQLQSTDEMSYLDLVGGPDFHDLSSDQLISILSSDCHQLTNNRVRQRMVVGVLAVEGAHCILQVLLGIGVVLAYIPEQTDQTVFSSFSQYAWQAEQLSAFTYYWLVLVFFVVSIEMYFF